MTTTDVGVDAVLSADVGDAPMRQRQYTAPVHAPSAQAPSAAALVTPNARRRLSYEPLSDRCALGLAR